MSRGTSTLGIDNVEIYTDRKPLIERQYGLPLFFIDDFFFQSLFSITKREKNPFDPVHLLYLCVQKWCFFSKLTKDEKKN